MKPLPGRKSLKTHIKRKEEIRMTKDCHVNKKGRKKAGKHGKGLCSYCYPAGSKRRAEWLAAQEDIRFALNVTEEPLSVEDRNELDFIYELYRIIEDDNLHTVDKIAAISIIAAKYQEEE